MKARPSFEKRRKETQRQERNRDKEERRKTRKDERVQRALTGAPGDETDVLQSPLDPENSDTGREAALVHPVGVGEAEVVVSARMGAEAISSKDSTGAAKQ